MIFEELKLAAKVLKEAGKIEQYKQILETLEKLLEMQKKIIDLENENRKLKGELITKENLIIENNAYWMLENDKKDGPFCTCCWDAEQKLIRMHPCGNPAFYNCPNCKSGSVQIDPSWRPAPPRKRELDPYL